VKAVAGTARLDDSPARGPAILVVDDDATQLKLTQVRLRAAGFQVETARSASEALEKVRWWPPAAILSDVLMADVDGFALCRELREEPGLADVPVILLSAHYRTDEDRALAARVGASAFVVRTPSFEDEAAALQRCLQERTTATIESVDRELYEQHLRTNAQQMTRLLGQARSAEDRYRSLFENASDAITVLTRDGIVLDANRRWGELLGVAPEEMIGRRAAEFLEPGYAAARPRECERTLREGVGSADGVPVRRADGSILYMNFSVTPVEIGGSSLLFSIGRDVTREILAADALAQAEAKYRSLIERLPDVIWTTRADGVLTMITPNVRQVLGYSSEEIGAEDVETRLSRVHPDDRQQVRQAFERLLAGENETFEYRRQHADGRWVWLKNRTIGRYERDGETYVDGVLTDITEHKRLEESMRQAQKMEAVARLTGGIAHDFNNMLAAILANCHFLMEGLAAHDPRRSDAQEIQAAAERAAALTRQLLAFSRKQRLEPRTVDMNATVVKLEKMLRRLIGEDIELVVKHGDELGAVRVDVGQMEQVIMNLVVNARDAMPQGGRLTIEVRNIELAPTQTAQAAVPGGRYVTVAVSDTGVGMDTETKRRLFEPFFTTKDVGKGTGLGLSTCYGILKQSGGHIDVASEPHHGSTFTVYLPRVDAAVSSSEETPSPDSGDGHETILVVEDDPHVRSALRRILARRGYRVLTACNAGEALELAQRHEATLDLVLSDVVMPGTSGPELIERLSERFDGVRTLLMSGYIDHALLQRANCPLGTSVLQKPFQPEALALAVRQALDASPT
jgi:two-component system cell cycle sensor histidine kinase/response regulator CckA